MAANPPTILLSSGEPAGIGPDLCALLALESIAARLVVLADPELLVDRARALQLDVEIQPRGSLAELDIHTPGRLDVLAVPASAPVAPGRLNPANAQYVLEILRRGTQLCRETERSALVTTPVQKSVINEAGIQFTGHTEYLAELTDTPRAVMMLLSEGLRVALATTHLPLREVAASIDAERLEQVIHVLHRDLQRRFDLPRPRITVLGLNPHAGESGNLGDEEQRIICPLIEELTGRGLHLVGPLPADTAFTPQGLAQCDAVLAMYHDQGLPAVKALAFGKVVNVTLGLPIIRTSVDHGTALGLAGTGRANADSLKQALRVALELIARCP